ncbi:MAG TPA: hypothetical protein VLA51_06860 [Paracoccaceae bacterium]|nr:hypothetical protein [Paracoccaceae bacterium]
MRNTKTRSHWQISSVHAAGKPADDLGVADLFRALMQQQRQIMNRGAIAAQQALLARIEAMTDDERAEFAEHLGKQGRR